ncbi:hypothetical protein Y1Q_0009491 [Alligator mississippiensis]|uniref:Uncharacterized protein n=1 Tax=Alligator mississippiensis TaxID=8496 RepID=A0A151P1N6_ALLMI|nr:hypothetical protein Y1Q_0009491 [Alligator mississippiensis]
MAAAQHRAGFPLHKALDCSGSAGWRTALVPPLQNGEAIADDFWLPKGVRIIIEQEAKTRPRQQFNLT